MEILLAHKWTIIGLLYWLYTAMCFQIMGRKLGIQGEMMAYVPGLNLIYLWKLAEKPVFLVVLFVVPFVPPYLVYNYVPENNWLKYSLISLVLFPAVVLYVFSAIAKNRDKSPLFSVIMMVPVFQLVAFSYLAFSDSDSNGKALVGVLLILILGGSVGGTLYVKQAHPEIYKQVTVLVVEKFENVKNFYFAHEKSIEESKKDQIMIKEDVFYMWVDAKGNEQWVMSFDEVPVEFKDQARKVGSSRLGDGFRTMTTEEEGEVLNQEQGPVIPENFKHADHQIIIYSYQGNKHHEETVGYLDKFNMVYEVVDVLANPDKASELKMKLGLDINKKYENLILPIMDINGMMVERVIVEVDKKGKIIKTELNTNKVNKIFGLRETFE